MNNEELEEKRQYIISLYDELLMKTENRGVSYGELAYINNLTQDELEEIEKEILEELESESE